MLWRIIIKDRKIQGIELFVKEEEKTEPLELKVPVIYEEKFSKPGSVEELIKAFKIPSQLPEEKEEGFLYVRIVYLIAKNSNHP